MYESVINKLTENWMQKRQRNGKGGGWKSIEVKRSFASALGKFLLRLSLERCRGVFAVQESSTSPQCVSGTPI